MPDQQIITPPDPPGTCRTFGAFIGAVEYGKLHGELTEALRTLNKTLCDHAAEFGGKAKGSLSLTIDLTLNGGLFEISADYKTKLPKAKRDRSVMWTTPNGDFAVSDPRQPRLPLRDVTPPAAEHRTA